MYAFKLVTCCVSLLAFASLSADEPPFDVPLALQEITPLLEEADFLESAPTNEQIKNSFRDDFHALPLTYVEEEDTDLAPDFLNASVTFAASKEDVLPVDVLVDSFPSTLVQPLSFEVSEKQVINETAPTSASLPMPAPRVESTKSGVQIDMREVFAGAPLIYSVLLAISIATVALWAYTQLNMRTEKLMPQAVVATLQEKISAGKLDEALSLCQTDPSVLGKMIRSGLLASRANQAEMVASMQSEGKRVTGNFWQKLALLNDVAIVAPMIGLLGTVVGMFYAFYDINRSVESMNSLFDGLGISVGTTVAGLILAIVALVMHSTSKYRLVKQLSQVESTANSLASRMYHRKEEQNS